MTVEAVPVTYTLEGSQKASAERLAIQVNKALERGAYVGHIAVGSRSDLQVSDQTEGFVFLVDVPDHEH